MVEKDEHREMMTNCVSQIPATSLRGNFVTGRTHGVKKYCDLLVQIIILGIYSTVAFFALYYLASSPPMHWFYEVGKVAGPRSVYLPGGGFTGFWFHLGYLHSIGTRHNLYDYDYYCFSAGCLSILSVFLNRSLEEVYVTALATQNAWKSGNRSRFEIVEYFVDHLLPETDNFDCIENVNEAVCSETSYRLDFLPRLKILVTTPSNGGFAVLESESRDELKEYILRTTWIPFLTGGSFLIPTTEKDADGNHVLYLDGAFSRTLHPPCEVEWNLPLMWETLFHTFNPGLTREQVQHLWEKGARYEYPIPEIQNARKSPNTKI